MFLALALACGSVSMVAATPPHVAEVVAPWSDFDLPIGEARVVWCDSTNLTLEFEGEQVGTLSNTWRRAARVAGFVEDLDTSSPSMTNVRYVRDQTAANLSIVAAGGRTSVVVTLVPAPPSGD